MRYLEENTEGKPFTPDAWACYDLREDIRRDSSSGGLFYLLAGSVIARSGVVFGVRWNEKWEAIHDEAESMEEVRAFMGSKYVQSDTRDTFARVQHFLSTGRLVLYSGTPCQIAGLKSFLQKEYENLIAVDIICHGVPSPVVWRRYLSELAGDKRVTGVSFRDKTKGWRDFSIKVSYQRHRPYRKSRRSDRYMRGFLKNIDLRPSCYECPFKGSRRSSDLTLGDFWGAEQVLPELDDDGGLTLVLVWSEAGGKILDDVSAQLTRRKIDMSVVEAYNTAYLQSVAEPGERSLFFAGLREENRIIDLLGRATGGSLLQRAAAKIFNHRETKRKKG